MRDMNPYYTAENKDLVLSVAANNPGALEATRQLQWFSRWENMLVWLQENDYTGPKLWELYKDRFHQSSLDLGHWIEKEMIKDMKPPEKIKGKVYPFFKEYEDNIKGRNPN